MLTYDLTKTHGPMYDALYRAIRADILGGTLAPGNGLWLSI